MQPDATTPERSRFVPIRASTRARWFAATMAFALMAVASPVAVLAVTGSDSPPARGRTAAVDAARLAAGAATVSHAAVNAGTALQIAPSGEPSIVVNGIGEASAPAETATIQFVIGRDEFAMGMAVSAGSATVIYEEGEAVAEGQAGATPAAGAPEDGAVAGDPGRDVREPIGPTALPRLTEEDLEPVLQAITDAGVARDDIEVVTGPGLSSFFGPGGPGAARLEFALDKPSAEQVAEIVDAVDAALADNGLSLQYAGVGYDLADCSALQRQAKQQAIDNARAQAEETADLLGVTLGDLLQAYDSSYFGPSFVDETGCGPSPAFGGSPFGSESGITTPPFDPTAPAEAEAYSQMVMTYAIGEDAS